eukprot:m.978381 g.978381  ORF g.978381 m.978381 type:complete len:539 (+) comp23956_c1_seq20:62-1678(+)
MMAYVRTKLLLLFLCSVGKSFRGALANPKTMWGVSRPVALAAQPVAKPTQQQLQWQDLEVSSMLGWNLQTICRPQGQGGITSQRCQASSKTEGALFVPDQETIANWNPYAVDTDEWARVSASFGAKYIVLVADHMTGFTLWDTKYHNYSIAHTKYKGGGGDIVKELIESCKKYNIKLGFFYSVHFNWYLGVSGYKVGHPPLGPRTYTQEEYLAIAMAQLREVSRLFGDDGPVEIWFDGGTGPSASVVGPVVHEVVPNAVCHSCDPNFTAAGAVRWMGNEEGRMPLPSWGSGATANGGDPLGTSFEPPSSDTVLREHYWFHQNGTENSTRSTLQLVHTYLATVGRASNLILNVAPDGTGAIPSSDVTRYAEMGAAVKCLFSQPLGDSSAVNATLPMDVHGGMTFALPAPAVSSNISIVLRELQTEGQLIGNYSLMCAYASTAPTTKQLVGQEAAVTDPAWEPCVMGGLSGVMPTKYFPGIGHKRILVLTAPQSNSDTGSQRSLTHVRVQVYSHFATGTQVPTLRDISLYDWMGKVESCV